MGSRWLERLEAAQVAAPRRPQRPARVGDDRSALRERSEQAGPQPGDGGSEQQHHQQQQHP